MRLFRAIWFLAVAACLAFPLSLLGCASQPTKNAAGELASSASAMPLTSQPMELTAMSNRTYSKPSDADLRRSLTPLQYEVTQHDATEPPFQNAYWNNHQAGLYVDVVTGEPLFASVHKFDSGTGWPSFTQPVEPERVISRVDRSHGMSRTEVRSRAGNSHLGHIFNDGPAPTGLRYCINSASLRFIPVDKLQAEGYSEYQSLFGAKAQSASAPIENKQATECSIEPSQKPSGCQSTLETAILAGGCFWGMEDILRKIPGVLETEAGYTGGTTSSPNYDQVHTGRTGHAEAVRVVFDPTKLSYDELLTRWFFRMHDPTTSNRQGNDVGSQYRSAIFYTTPEQKQIAEAAKVKAQQSGLWKSPIVTEIVQAGPFYRAEDYHQKYLEHNPGGYTCHFLR